jgi:FdrA protein
LVGAARRCGKPVVFDLIGEAGFHGPLGNLHFASSLEDAAEIAVEMASSSSAATTPSTETAGGARFVRGLFSGGTLAYEAVLALQYALAPLATNVPLRAEQRLSDPLQSRGNTILDLGADDFTVGRLHPMIDNDLRLRRLRQEAADPETAVILLDVVLGAGAHPDPASELAPAIADALRRAGLTVIVVLIGTDEDPQGFESQAEQLRAAGALVFPGLQAALAAVVQELPAEEGTWPRPVPLESFASPAAINVGLESFFDSLVAQGAAAVQLDWRPPAGGDERLMKILSKMKAGQGTTHPEREAP